MPTIQKRLGFLSSAVEVFECVYLDGARAVGASASHGLSAPSLASEFLRRGCRSLKTACHESPMRRKRNGGVSSNRESTMNALDRELIRESKARYCRFLDSKQWEAFSALFLESAQIQVIDPQGALTVAFDGRHGFVESARAFLEGAQSIHQVHNDEIGLASVDEVAAIWSMEDYIRYPDAAPGQVQSVHGYGHYFESWRKQRSGWRIASLQLRRSLLETTFRSHFT